VLGNNQRTWLALNSLIVKLPVFVTAIINSEYLSGDSPTILARTFGDSLTENDNVTIQVDSETLGLHQTINGKAFSSIPIPLGKMKTGNHQISIKSTTQKGSYKLERSFRVLDSRLTIQKSNYQVLQTDTKISGSPQGFYHYRFLIRVKGNILPHY
jgi:hypothetical protein